MPQTLPTLSELEGWCPSFGTDADVASKIAAVMPSYEQSLEPATAEEIAVGLHSALSLFNPPDNFQDTAKIYLKALANVPKDLLPVSIEAVSMRCKFFPKPADFLEPVEKEISHRKHLISVAKHYLWWFRKSEKRKATLKERRI